MSQVQIPEEVQEFIDELKKEFNIKSIEYRDRTGRVVFVIPYLTGNELYTLQKMVSEIVDIMPTSGPDEIKFKSGAVKRINLEVEVKP